jgi:hypothetical protein
MNRENADEYREEMMEERAKRRGCLCGYPDWPGQCPGPENCPVHGEFDTDEENSHEHR